MLRRMSRDRYLSDAELERFLTAARERRHVHQPRDYALFVFIVNTGIRPSEAMTMRRRDMHLCGKDPWVRLRRAKLRHRPDPTNELELNREVAAVLRRHCDRIAPAERPWGMTKRQAERLFHYYAGKAGIPPGYHLFSLRHTAGMRLYSHTRDVRLIQAVMGHRWLKAANTYVHTSRETIRQAIEAATA